MRKNGMVADIRKGFQKNFDEIRHLGQTRQEVSSIFFLPGSRLPRILPVN